MTNPLLKITQLKTTFRSREGELVAVDQVSFDLLPGEILGLIGESGSGKTVTGLSILSLLPESGRIAGGDIFFKGKSLRRIPEKEFMNIRGSEIAYIFQDPTTSLNPTKTVGWQIQHILETKRKDLRGTSPDNAIREMTRKLLEDVGILSPEKVMSLYPHNLSGGMLQRILIAMALGCSPDILIADEPTTNLDVIVEAQILKLFTKFREIAGCAILFISHDIGVISETCDRVLVLYAGKIMESGSIYDVLNDACHPYTRGLLQSSPKLEEESEVLYQIKGELPGLWNLPKGCRFWPRCERGMPVCRKVTPSITEIKENHFVACHLYP